MKYIKNFEEINESLFSRIVNGIALLSSLYIGGSFLSKYINQVNKDKKEYIESVKIENASKLPNSEQQKVIDSARNDVIIDINQSDYNDSTKKFIIDTLNKVTFLISYDTTNQLTKAIKAYYNNKLEFNKDHKGVASIILIKNKTFSDKDVKSTLRHEMYHFIDNMLKYPSSFIDYSEYIDFDFYENDKYAKNKVILIQKLNPIKVASNPTANSKIRDLYQVYREDQSYITKPSEIYARYKTFKTHLAQNGIEPLTTKNISKYIDSLTSNREKYGDYQSVQFLYSMRIDKIEELSNILK